MINQGPFFESFSSLPDPRKDINKKHLMIDMLFITLCAVISGVRSWEDIEEFAIDREEWLRKYISLPYGIPSHDAIRKHWKIENSLHWSLDISFNEDQCRKRVKNSAKNISTVRKMALTMLKTEETFKASINAKMLKACRKTEYLEKVLNI